jgi:hypothetical protein
MIEKTVRMVSEGLARGMDRRKFLKRASGTIFAGLSALAAGQIAPSLASAGAGSQLRPDERPPCYPPGPFCNLDGNQWSTSGCHGASCYEHLYQGRVLQCRVYYTYYPTGCWTTRVNNGYWTCCDCQCGGNPPILSCGCAQWSTTPVPRPDSPGGASA